jgi:hypothetical protein
MRRWPSAGRRHSGASSDWPGPLESAGQTAIIIAPIGEPPLRFARARAGATDPLRPPDAVGPKHERIGHAHARRLIPTG